VNSSSAKAALKATNSASVKAAKKDKEKVEKDKEKDKDDDSGDDNNDAEPAAAESRIVADLCASLKAEPKLIRARIVGLLRFPKSFSVSLQRRLLCKATFFSHFFFFTKVADFLEWSAVRCAFQPHVARELLLAMEV
jgi:hypothetical protein